MADSPRSAFLRVQWGGSFPNPQPGEAPFRIAVWGDFSGRASREELEDPNAVASRPVLRVQPSRFNQLMDRLKVQCRISLGAEPENRFELPFRCLEDWEPDRLFQQLPVFQELRELRQRLLDPATYHQAVAEMGGQTGQPHPAEPPGGPDRLPSAPQDEQTREGLLDQVIQATPEQDPVWDWKQLVEDIVRPHLVPKRQPHQSEWVQKLDSAASGLMSALLHHTHVQALESAWRGLHFLVNRLGAEVHVDLIDVTKSELARDLAAQEDLSRTGLYRLLVEPAAGQRGGQAGGHSLWVGLYDFDRSHHDLELLGRIGCLAEAAGTAFATAASSRFVSPDPEESLPGRKDPVDEQPDWWPAFRQLPMSDYLALVWPRFLLRLPHGKDTNPSTAFAYEETQHAWNHEAYLWGNPALLVAYAWGQARQHPGRGAPSSCWEIDRLPLHVYQDGGEPRAHPCGEQLLPDKTRQQLLRLGLTPVCSLPRRDAVSLGPVQSVSGQPLKGSRT